MIAAAGIGFALGVIVSQLFLDGQVRKARDKMRDIRDELASGLEHEAFMRDRIKKLESDNLYLRVKNMRNKL